MNNINKKILLAEDDKFLVKIYKSKLEEMGYTLDIACDGQEALDYLQNNKPDLLMLDIIMPRKNGFEVLEAMQANPELSAIPVIVLSNLGQETDVQRAMTAGAKDYLVKANVSVDEMLNKVNMLLNG